LITYVILCLLVDELPGLALGRNIVKNLHMAGKKGLLSGLETLNHEFKEPLYDATELCSIAPTDLKQSFDIRSVIARIVDGSEFDEFKKLYGTVRAYESLKLVRLLCVSFLYLLIHNPNCVNADSCNRFR
jgi:hypothetical protein